jgi:hypothetical protein
MLTHSNLELQDKLGCFLKTASTGLLLRIHPKVSGIQKNNMACLGCKKLFHKIPLQEAHKQNCANKESHIAICKSLLGETQDAPTIVQPKEVKSVECQTDPFPAGTQGPPLPSPIDGVNDDIRFFLKDIMDEIREISESHFLKKMIQFQESYSLGFQKVMSTYFKEAPEILHLMEQEKEA